MADQNGHDTGKEASAFTASSKLPPGGHRNVLDIAIEFVGVILLTIVCVSIFSTATGRYFFNRPLIWAEELCISLLPWVGMIGFYMSCRKRDLIRFTILYEKYSSVGRAISDTAAAILAVICFGYLAYLSFNFMMMFGGDRLPYSGLARGYVIAALPVGLFAVTLTYLLSYYKRTIRKKEG